MTLGLIDSMELDRVNFRLTLKISAHPRRGEPETIVETFSTLEAMLERYDRLVHEDDVRRAQEDAPQHFAAGNGKGEL